MTKRDRRRAGTGALAPADARRVAARPAGTAPMPPSSAAFRPDPDRDPIGPFLHYLMAECGVSPNTLAAYRSDVAKFARWRRAHAPGPLAGLDVRTLSGYVEELARSGLAARSIGRHIASLPTFFR